MFEKEKKYKIQYAIKEQDFTFTGKVLEENSDFIKLQTIRGETMFLHLDRIIKIEEVRE